MLKLEEEREDMQMTEVTALDPKRLVIGAIVGLIILLVLIIKFC